LNVDFCQGATLKSNLATTFGALKKAFLQNARNISASKRSFFYCLLVGDIPSLSSFPKEGANKSLLQSTRSSGPLLGMSFALIGFQLPEQKRRICLELLSGGGK